MVSWSSCPLAVAWILLIHLQQSSSPSPPVLRHLPATIRKVTGFWERYTLALL